MPENTPALHPADSLLALYNREPVAGVDLILEDYEGEVELVSIEAKPQEQGLGATAMRRLTLLADEQGIDLMLLIAGPTNSEKHRRLKQFYSRFGFHVSSDDDIMRRQAYSPS